MPSAARQKPSRKAGSGPTAARTEAATDTSSIPATSPENTPEVAVPAMSASPATASIQQPAGPERWSAGLAGRRIFASCLALALGLGAVAGFVVGEHRHPEVASAAVSVADETRAALAAARAAGASDGEAAMARLADEVRGMRAELETLRVVLPKLAGVEDLRALGRQVATAAEVAEAERNRQGAALADALAGVVARVDQAATQAAGGLSELGTRMGRLDGALAARTPPADPTSTASLAKPAGRPAEHPAEAPKTEAPRAVQGWHVRGVFNGVALLEGPHGVYEAVRGDVVPGLGRIETIHRQGRGWSVVTSRGAVGQPHR